jgi:hypothetical protein
MTGAPDAVYIQARRVLLDALEALDEHRSALVLVGAQAIYLRTGEGGLAVAPYTIDGDIAPDDARRFEVAVAGPASLLVARWTAGTSNGHRDPASPRSVGLSHAPEPSPRAEHRPARDRVGLLDGRPAGVGLARHE